MQRKKNRREIVERSAPEAIQRLNSSRTPRQTNNVIISKTICPRNAMVTASEKKNMQVVLIASFAIFLCGIWKTCKEEL